MSAYDKNNIFAKIIRGEINSSKVFEDDQILAFNDIAAAAPVHILVVPKGEYISFDDYVVKESNERVAAFFAKVQKIANNAGLSKTGYRVITNNGPDASQSVPHFHVHILGGRSLGGLVPGDRSVR